MQLAQARSTDLLEIAPQANPPVVRIADFSKYLYEREKKLKGSRKHQKAGQVKEIRLRPGVSTHDLATKTQHTKEFLDQRFKVRLTVQFRGREMQHRELGLGILDKVKEGLEGKFVVEQNEIREGNRISILIAPKK